MCVPDCTSTYVCDMCVYVCTYVRIHILGRQLLHTSTYMYSTVLYMYLRMCCYSIDNMYVLRFPPPYCTRLQQATRSRLYHWPNSLTCARTSDSYVACVVRLAYYWASVTVLAMFNTVCCQWWAILYAERVYGRGMCRSEWGVGWSIFHTLLCLCI